MNVHSSQYENDGWVNISKEKPPQTGRYLVARINIMDWNLETIIWKSTGLYNKEKDRWTISIKDMQGNYVKFQNPTHFKPV